MRRLLPLLALLAACSSPPDAASITGADVSPRTVYDTYHWTWRKVPPPRLVVYALDPDEVAAVQQAMLASDSLWQPMTAALLDSCAIDTTVPPFAEPEARRHYAALAATVRARRGWMSALCNENFARVTALDTATGHLYDFMQE